MKSSQGQKKNIQQVKTYFQTIKEKPALEIKFLIKNFLKINDPEQFKKILDNSELRKIPEWERFRTRFRAKQLDYLIDKIKLYIDQVKTNLKEGGSQKKYKGKLNKINPIIQINQDTRSRFRVKNLKKMLQTEGNLQTLKNILQQNSLIPQNYEEPKNMIIPWDNIFLGLESYEETETFLDLLFKKRNFDFRYRVDQDEFQECINSINRMQIYNNSLASNFFLVFTCMYKFFRNKKIDWQKYCHQRSLDFIKKRLKENLEKYDKNEYHFKKEFDISMPNPHEKIKIIRDFLNPKQPTQKQKYKTYLDQLKKNYEKKYDL